MCRICGKLDDHLADGTITSYIGELQAKHSHKFRTGEEQSIENYSIYQEYQKFIESKILGKAN